ncbi:major capsid protein [Capybara microvirus Cap3_SP_469]|nr:major capsid protein [Capybara microvirus Cap3_SP_469]
MFAENPNVNIGRSTFRRASGTKTSFNVGELVPIYLDEVLPGDTFKLDTSFVLRMPSLISPILDDLYLDTFFFYVPSRLTWVHWRNLMGENTESAWIPETEYEVPQVTSPEGGWSVGSLADYFGIPTGVDNLSISALPFRAYALIVNEFFRDQNLQDPVNVLLDDSNIIGNNGDNYITDLVKGGKPFIAAKLHDFFTSSLPGPQRGPSVEISPIIGGNLNVFGNGYSLPVTDGNVVLGTGYVSENIIRTGRSNFGVSVGSNASFDTGLSINKVVGVPTKEQLGNNPEYSGLIADGTGLASSITVNALRMATQIQKMYEADARGGTRYRELILNHFGVHSPDARLQIPEYLGGQRQRIQIQQVIQSSATNDVTPQGNAAAYSLTGGRNYDFTKSFTEHGFVIGLACVRYNHTYGQGIPKLFSKKSRFSYFWPKLCNIGEQPTLNKEIYAQGTSEDEEVFGYQEAWADYRYKPSIATGYMNPAHNLGLQSWSLVDRYNQLPALSSEWIKEDKSNVDRIIAASSEITHQFFGDFMFNNICVRPMPMHSIPGLMDHH